ncbi:MAG: hypothetical protein ACREWJ_02610 [Rhodoferax sp.]
MSFFLVHCIGVGRGAVKPELGVPQHGIDQLEWVVERGRGLQDALQPPVDQQACQAVHIGPRSGDAHGI